MPDRRWDDERSMQDAPAWLSAEEASSWAAGWNAAVRECVSALDAAAARECPERAEVDR